LKGEALVASHDSGGAALVAGGAPVHRLVGNARKAVS
jgi:hypothetical protein